MGAVSLHEYRNAGYRPDCEFLDGELLERNVGEQAHSRLQTLLGGYLHAREKQWNILVFLALRVQVKATRIRVPDILVLAGTAQREPILTHPPFLCIEILSPADRMAEMQDRIQDYLTFGVSYVWVIDPRSHRAFIYTNDSVQEVKDGILRTSNPGIQVSLSDLE